MEAKTKKSGGGVRRRGLLGVSVAAGMLLGVGPAFGDVWHVDVNVAGGADDGTSWGDAFGDLQDALAVAAAGDEIWVARGVYKPGTTRSSAFRLPDQVALYGGFEGGETKRYQRRPLLNVTILNGDVDGDGTQSGNAYTVVFVQQVSGVELDGFLIRGGNAEGNGSGNEYTYCGGGMFVRGASIKVRGCRFRDNTAKLGGGAYLDDPSQGGPVTRAEFRCCTFDGNSATGLGTAGEGAGGAIGSGMQGDGDMTELVVRSCTFWGNTAQSSGGAIASEGFLRIFNGVFTGNTAEGVGGGVFTGCCDAAIVNSTFAGNYGAFGGGGAELSHTSVSNSVFWDNERDPPGTLDLDAQVEFGLVNFTNCDIMGLGAGGGVPGSGNFEADPMFRDAAGADGVAGNGDDRLSLSSGSPCEDAGDNGSVPGFLTGDRLENQRIACRGSGCTPVVDVGAYELQRLVKGDPHGVSRCSLAPGGESDGLQGDGPGQTDGGCHSCDLVTFFEAYAEGGPSADVNRDGWIDTADVVLFLNTRR